VQCKDRFHNKRRSQNLTVARLKYLLGCSSQDEYNAKVSAINTERDEDNAERDISWDAHNCHTSSLNDDNDDDDNDDDDSDAYLWRSY
jgi:hypothetical protein